MNTQTTSSKHKLNLKELYICACAQDGVCANETAPIPASLNWLTITAILKDPDHRLFEFSQLAKGAHRDSRTMTNELNIIYFANPDMELAFEIGEESGINALTKVCFDTSNLKSLFAEMIQARLVNSGSFNQPITLELACQILQFKISELLVLENSALPIGSLHPVINDLLPLDIGGLHRGSEAYCVGCPCCGKSIGDFDHWKLTAWDPDTSSMGGQVVPKSPWSVPTNHFAI